MKSAAKKKPQEDRRTKKRERSGVAVKTKIDKRMEQIRAHKFHTINIAEAVGETAHVSVNVHGTNEKNEPFDMNLKILRGVDVPNVPMAALLVLHNAVETRFDQEDKKGAKGGKRLVAKKVRSYPFHIVESYDEKIEVEGDGEGLEEIVEEED